MTTFTIALSDEQAQTLQQQAQHTGTTPEELLRQNTEVWLAQSPSVHEPAQAGDDFAAAAAYVLNKNAELYRRLS